MRNYEGFLRGLTRQTVDEASSKTEFDFVKKITADFPIQVLARLLDVPTSDTEQLIDWGNEMVGNTDPDYTRATCSPTESEKYKHLPFRSPTSLEVFDYGRELATRRGGDGTDLVCLLVNKSPRTASRCPRPTSTTTSCCSSSPATRPPGTRSATPCWP